MGCGGAASMDHPSPADGLCLSQQLSQVSLHHDPRRHLSILPPLPIHQLLSSLPDDELAVPDDSSCSQDFFCTPDFLTPVEQQFPVDFDGNKENLGFLHSPLKSSPVRSKRPRPDAVNLQQPVWPNSSDSSSSQPEQISVSENCNGVLVAGPQSQSLAQMQIQTQSQIQPHVGYDPPSSRARLASLRRRVLSPPCIKNPFRSEDNGNAIPTEKPPPKQAQFLPVLGASCLSRYREEFHEIQEIGNGNFSIVFKVLKRLDGCLYAVKRTHRQLQHDSERRQALTEVQALAAVGLHENVVRYHTAWFENDYLYIQMELCDGTLRNWKPDGIGSFERFLIEALRQVAQALAFIHSRGLVHLDVKPDNIYYVGHIFKLGDFGRATRLDGTISIEEGDARYMPLEIINDDYCHLPKADIFALGASIYELARNHPLPSSGSQFQALRQGRLPLLPGFSLPFQNLLKNLMHPNPEIRPTSEDLLKNAVFRSAGIVEAAYLPRAWE